MVAGPEVRLLVLLKAALCDRWLQMKLKGPSANDDVIDNVPAKASGEKKLRIPT